MDLPNPLTADDELRFSRFGTHDLIKVTAGVHRQTCVSGIAVFADVRVSNNSQKTVKKIELQLERVTAASTDVENRTHLRIPDRIEKGVLVSCSVNKERHGWQGIFPESQDVGTYNLDIPPGLATIDTGMFIQDSALTEIGIYDPDSGDLVYGCHQ